MSSDDGGSYVREALGGAIDGEPLVVAQWCRPGRSTEKGHEGFGRKLGRLLGGKDDGLRDMNVLAATGTRLVLYSAKQGWQGLQLQQKIGEWPLGEARLGSRDRTATTEKHVAHTAHIEKMHTDLTSLTLPDGRVVESPRGPTVRQLVDYVNGT